MLERIGPHAVANNIYSYLVAHKNIIAFHLKDMNLTETNFNYSAKLKPRSVVLPYEQFHAKINALDGVGTDTKLGWGEGSNCMLVCRVIRSVKC